jgi:hypothetical protein
MLAMIMPKDGNLKFPAKIKEGRKKLTKNY